MFRKLGKKSNQVPGNNSETTAESKQDIETEHSASMTDLSTEENEATAAENLAKALAEYEKYALDVERPEPDPSLINAHCKVRIAKEIVNTGRLNYALCRQLLEHVKYWPSWITHEGFHEKNVLFDATEIAASKRKEGEDKVEITDVSFIFGGRHYRLVFRDEGISFSSDNYYGTVEFQVDNHLVLAMNISKEIYHDGSYWRGYSVEAFDPGDWMQELLTISAQIEMRNKAKLKAYLDERVLEASANINLPEETS